MDLLAALREIGAPPTGAFADYLRGLAAAGGTPATPSPSGVICFAAGAQGHDFASLVIPVGYDAQTIDPSSGDGRAVMPGVFTLNSFSARLRGDVTNAGISILFELHVVRGGGDAIIASCSIAADALDGSANAAPFTYVTQAQDQLYVLTVISAPPVANVCLALSASVGIKS